MAEFIAKGFAKVRCVFYLEARSEAEAWDQAQLGRYREREVETDGELLDWEIDPETVTPNV